MKQLTFNWRKAMHLLICIFAIALALLSQNNFAQSRHIGGGSASADDVKNAILNSPYANQWIRDNAAFIGGLSQFESGGSLDVYNGSCCYGILQVSNSNIHAYGNNMSAETFRRLSLQEQVNIWAKFQSAALSASAPRQLMGMTTFDGRKVDASLIMACVQLGQGNCAKMVSSGRCDGFADINGTTVCKMADVILKNLGKAPLGGGTASASSGGAIAEQNPAPSLQGWQCRTRADGSCMSRQEAMDMAFEEGSGVPPYRLKNLLYIIIALAFVMMYGEAAVHSFYAFAEGRISFYEMLRHFKTAGITMAIVIGMLTLF